MKELHPNKKRKLLKGFQYSSMRTTSTLTTTISTTEIKPLIEVDPVHLKLQRKSFIQAKSIEVSKKLPKQFSILFQGHPQVMLQAVANALITMKFEWQFIQKEMKLKCRTKFNEI